MVMNPLIKKAYWSLAAMGALYFVFLGCLANPWVQRKYVFNFPLLCYFTVIRKALCVLIGCVWTVRSI